MSVRVLIFKNCRFCTHPDSMTTCLSSIPWANSRLTCIRLTTCARSWPATEGGRAIQNMSQYQLAYEQERQQLPPRLHTPLVITGRSIIYDNLILARNFFANSGSRCFVKKELEGRSLKNQTMALLFDHCVAQGRTYLYVLPTVPCVSNTLWSLCQIYACIHRLSKMQHSNTDLLFGILTARHHLTSRPL